MVGICPISYLNVLNWIEVRGRVTKLTRGTGVLASAEQRHVIGYSETLSCFVSFVHPVPGQLIGVIPSSSKKFLTFLFAALQGALSCLQIGG